MSPIIFVGSFLCFHFPSSPHEIYTVARLGCNTLAGRVRCVASNAGWVCKRTARANRCQRARQVARSATGCKPWCIGCQTCLVGTAGRISKRSRRKHKQCRQHQHQHQHRPQFAPRRQRAATIGLVARLERPAAARFDLIGTDAQPHASQCRRPYCAGAVWRYSQHVGHVA